MKKSILLLSLFIPLFCLGQFNDTIFYKNGKIEPVYNIFGVNNNNLYYTLKPQSISTTSNISLIDSIKTLDKEIISKFSNAKSEGQLSSKTTIENNKDDIYWENGILVTDKTITPLQYNLYKFYKQKRAGHICIGAGIISGVIYGLDPYNNYLFAILSGGLSLASFIIDIDSYKWIKRASLETNTNGITLKVKF